MNRKIVVYYSYTGNTRKIAQIIKERLNCDILELEPIEPYSKDYDLVVREEQNNASSGKLREYKETNIDLSLYDTIILGSPVWWYSIAPVIRCFLSKNDLSGKTIIPFATNAGWLGQTFKEIERLCPNSKVEKEMNIEFDAGDYRIRELTTPKSQIDKWIDEIRL